MEHLIQKVNITEEAEFDIECMNALSNFDKKEIKEILEFYINQNGKVVNKQYFRARDYIGEIEVIFFIRRSIRFASMQTWDIIGICEAEYWNQELEEDGFYRNWYDTKLRPEKNEPDWVEEERERKILEERELLKDEKERQYYEELFGY